jgi:hypothetical protein
MVSTESTLSRLLCAYMYKGNVNDGLVNSLSARPEPFRAFKQLRCGALRIARPMRWLSRPGDGEHRDPSRSTARRANQGRVEHALEHLESMLDRAHGDGTGDEPGSGGDGGFCPDEAPSCRWLAPRAVARGERRRSLSPSHRVSPVAAAPAARSAFDSNCETVETDGRELEPTILRLESRSVTVALVPSCGAVCRRAW